ncbi:MAG: hypothetical protein P8J33_04810 [Pirellulaceae bacterium]|nr:hypothetical protein [Pirellulaceae bacterium]
MSDGFPYFLKLPFKIMTVLGLWWVAASTLWAQETRSSHGVLEQGGLFQATSIEWDSYAADYFYSSKPSPSLPRARLGSVGTLANGNKPDAEWLPSRIQKDASADLLSQNKPPSRFLEARESTQSNVRNAGWNQAGRDQRSRPLRNASTLAIASMGELNVPPPIGVRNAGTREPDFKLAAQPKFGEHFHHATPKMDPAAISIEPEWNDFSPTPICPLPYDPGSEIFVYEGKVLNANQRPLVELGRPWYQLGQLKPGGMLFGSHNLVSNQFLIYGDYRMAYVNAKNIARDENHQVAFELNLNFDWRITATERVTAFVSPFDNGIHNSAWLFDEDRFVDETNFNVLFGMFEGDLGAIVGGLCGQTMPFDLPFALGVMPMLVQNGVWMDDAITGVAATVPARNCARLGISNMDTTFFAAFDEIDSQAFEGDNSASRMFGTLSFLEACGGYWEIDYAFLDDRDQTRLRSYHNIGLAFTRRYGRFISNSIRVIGNAGQQTINGSNTADGLLLLLENSLITSQPNSLIPYFNLWAGFDRPQSVARAQQAGGILNNTGILFESDGMTNFPTLDNTANDTWGGALGVNILTPNYDQQLILEFAFLKAMGSDATRIAPGDQAGLGARYQIPISNAWILRSDMMYGFFENTADVRGARMELRMKF